MLGLRAMKPLRATVQNGRITLDEPTDLPEGTILYLEPVETLDDMDPDERQALLAAIDRSMEDERQGRLIPASEAIAELRRRRP
jgi:hypothetical protein